MIYQSHSQKVVFLGTEPFSEYNFCTVKAAGVLFCASVEYSAEWSQPGCHSHPKLLNKEWLV